MKPACAVTLGLMLVAVAPLAAAERPSRSIHDLSITWENDHGEAVQLSQWKGQRVFLTLGYSTCERICPMTIDAMKNIERKLGEQAKTAAFIIISLDPKNDTRRKLAGIRRRRGLDSPHWHLLRTSEEETQRFKTLLGYESWRSDYHILHNYRIYVFDESGQIERVLDWESKIEDVL